MSSGNIFWSFIWQIFIESYCDLGTVLKAGDTPMRRQIKALPSWRLHSRGEDKKIKKLPTTKKTNKQISLTYNLGNEKCCVSLILVKGVPEEHHLRQALLTVY